MLGEADVVARNEGVLTAEVDGEAVMFHPDRGAYFALGEVGTRVWSVLEQPRTAADLCDALRSEFGVDRSTCVQDVLAFLLALEEAGLIEVRG